MTDRETLYRGASHAAWGYFFLYLDINLGALNILPDWPTCCSSPPSASSRGSGGTWRCCGPWESCWRCGTARTGAWPSSAAASPATCRRWTW